MVPSFGIGQDAVHAEHVFVLDVRCRAVVGFQAVESAVEVSHPETALAVRGQRGNIAIAQGRRTGMQNRLPGEAMSTFAIKAAAGYRKNGVIHPEQLVDFRQLRCVRRGRIGPATSFERNGNDTLIFGAHK